MLLWLRMPLTAVVAALMVMTAGAAWAGSIQTLFTGIQDGVNLTPPPAGDPNTIVNTMTPFGLGSGGFTANFGGNGFAFHAGVPELYRFAEGGRNAWGVMGEGVGTITFDQAAARRVTLYARGTNDGINSPVFGQLNDALGTLRAFGPDGSLIGSQALSNAGLQQFMFAGPIRRIEIVNESGAPQNSVALIAQLEAQAVPTPTAAVPGLLLLAGLAAARRRARATAC